MTPEEDVLREGEYIYKALVDALQACRWFAVRHLNAEVAADTLILALSGKVVLVEKGRYDAMVQYQCPDCAREGKGAK